MNKLTINPHKPAVFLTEDIQAGYRRTKGKLYLTNAECKKRDQGPKSEVKNKTLKLSTNKNQNQHWRHKELSMNNGQTSGKAETKYTDTDDETRNR